MQTLAVPHATMDEVNPFRRSRNAPQPAAVPTLVDLLGAVGRGDESAFARFYDEVAGLVHGIVLRVVRDPAMGEEVTQDVFVELWRLAPRFDPSRGSVRGWTATVAHRRAVDRVRSEQARREREDADHREQARTPPTDVAEEVTDHLDRARVTAALDALSDHQREAVVLAYFGGYTYRDVALLLDTPEGTVKTRIRDALIKLRDDLGAGR